MLRYGEIENDMFAIALKCLTIFIFGKYTVNICHLLLAIAGYWQNVELEFQLECHENCYFREIIHLFVYKQVERCSRFFLHF